MTVRRGLRTLCLSFCLVIFVCCAGYSADAPKEKLNLKAEGGKMAPVPFSHETHKKIDCVKCHHKDPKDPKACTTCHMVKEVKNKAPVAKDAFHNLCITCHKEVAAKGTKVPTKCNECHKK
jgi:hypothetical protein